MKIFRITKWLVALALASVITAMFLRPFHIGNITVSIGSNAKSLLKQLGIPNDATQVSDISVYGPDGPMPQIATRSFSFAGTAQTAQNFYLEKCQAASFNPPGEDILKLDPAAICERIDESGAFTVFLYKSCARSVCDFSIEVRHHTSASGYGL